MRNGLIKAVLIISQRIKYKWERDRNGLIQDLNKSGADSDHRQKLCETYYFRCNGIRTPSGLNA